MINRKEIRKRKSFRIRKKIKGTESRPRMTVFRSVQNIFVQLIDDEKGITLASSSTIDTSLKGSVNEKLSSNTNSAKIVGKSIAERALAKNIKKVVFDRNGYIYTGCIKALADSAREAGLEF